MLLAHDSSATWRCAIILSFSLLFVSHLPLISAGKSGKIGPGCKWTVPEANILQLSYVFTTGRAPNYRAWQKAASTAEVTQLTPKAPNKTTPNDGHNKSHVHKRAKGSGKKISYAAKVIVDRAKSDNTGSEISSASCPRLSTSASIESDALNVTNKIDQYYKDHEDEKHPVTVLVLWGGLQNSDQSLGSDLQQAIFFQGAGCNVNPQVAWCLYAAQENERYKDSKMCYSSRFPVAYSFKESAHVIYRTHVDFRSQEVWVGNKMFAYLRSEGNQTMNQIEFVQECINCAFPMNDQTYDGILITFEQPVSKLSDYGKCWGGASMKGKPAPASKDMRQWTIPSVVIPPMDGKTFYN